MARFSLFGEATGLTVDIGPDQASSAAMAVGAGESEAEFVWYSAPSDTVREDHYYHNAATCPDCGQGMIRLGHCLHCPGCGFSSCGA